MLLTKSFSITDDKGINAFLKTYRIAQGAGLMIGSGGLFRKPTILIPYEDGAAPNAAQRIVAIREDQNKLTAEKGIIEHSNRVLDHLVADAQSRIDAATAALEGAEDKKDHAFKRDQMSKRDAAQNALAQLTSQKKMNEHEVDRLQVNIDEYDIEIRRITAQETGYEG